jgi:YidC/Oxa1 family membrane protein insertase
LKEFNVDIVPEEGMFFISRIADTIVNFSHRVFEDSVVFQASHHGGVLVKSYVFSDQYGFDLTTAGANAADEAMSLKNGVRSTELKNRGDDLRHFNVFVKNGKVASVIKQIKDGYEYPGGWEWMAFRNKYFVLIVNNLGGPCNADFNRLGMVPAQVQGDRFNAGFGCMGMGGNASRFGVELYSRENFKLSVILLPIKYSLLAGYGRGYQNIASGGIWGPIARIILVIFNFFYVIFRNYGVVIIVFSVVLKAIFYPLSRLTIISQIKMQKLQPELKKIQQKFKNDQQALNQEMMHLYKAYKVNPFFGCLPLLIQFPIFFALYQVLATSIEFRQAKFLFWITDLSLKDPYYILPIGMGVMMLVQSLMTTVDPRQKFMVILMPVFMIFIFLNLPSGLQLYWFTYNILTIIEQYIVKRGGVK